MSEKTNISYCDHTWSPWLGCEPVSPGCAHCYASAISKRAGRGSYRHGMQRTLTKDWEKPKRWNKAAAIGAHLADACGRMEKPSPRVLVSMCDPFDSEVDNSWKGDFSDLIWKTPNLTWLLLTKRPENVSKIVPLPDNVWLGVSVENQQMADQRIPILLSIPTKIHFLSIEPMLGPIDLGRSFPCGYYCDESIGHVDHPFWSHVKTGIDWIIVGGESGFNHRKLEIEWMRSIVDQCKDAGVACYVKQSSHRFPGQQGRIPDELWKIKEFPKV